MSGDEGGVLYAPCMPRFASEKSRLMTAEEIKDRRILFDWGHSVQEMLMVGRANAN